ncbi:SDR family oxidoreductase [Ferrovibrio terrae]|uniref:SDR family oxidoreductase n=1 Tax=Ferrovibrio terrae TaxID=2594003 RepID=A0A516GXT1_9PROT|nr:SDR family oxidoreductase [Ferrovibrio terrae]QDO96354.1 SDR family oxidoreductase [Ferrovibrio terrae]
MDRTDFNAKWQAGATSALVTGASGAFGGAVAAALRRQGVHLLLSGQSELRLAETRARLEQAVPGATRIDLLPADLGQHAGQQQLALALQQQDIGILVHAAAVQGPIGPAWNNDPLKMRAAFEVNLFAAIALCNAAAAAMPARGGGKIICFSGGGATAPRADFSAYASTKAALVRYCECLAVETRDTGIDVNCIAPGAALTRMTREIFAAGAGVNAKERQAVETAAAGTEDTLGRAADLCAFLASPRSHGITGKLISAVWDPWPSLAEHIDDLQAKDIYTLRRIVPADRGLTWGN